MHNPESIPETTISDDGEKQGNETRGEGTLLGSLRSGEKVYDRVDSHLNVHQNVIDCLEEALSMIDSNGEKFLNRTVEFDEVVGGTNCVSVTQEDMIVYAVRKGRKGPTKFVMNRDPEPSSKVTVILKQDSNGSYYTLITAWIGDDAEPEPWDRWLKNNPEAKQRSEAFWDNHAIIYDPSIIAPETEGDKKE